MKTLLVAILFCPLILFGQKTHTVGPKETLFSIGRMYKVHPRELAEFNQIPYGSGLTIGQVLKIPGKKSMAPLTEPAPVNPAPAVPKTSTSPANVKAEYENVPLYHTVTKKETLFQISKKNKASIPDIKKWNHLRSDALKDGMQLIVGYKKQVKKQAENPVVRNTQPEISPVAIQKQEPVSQPVPVPVQPPVEEKKNVTVEETKMPPVSGQETDMPVKAANIADGGFFKSEYDQQVTGKATLKEKTGQASAFKSGSGWQDGKYYCLYNQAAPGSIIKVTHAATNKVVYVKVLDVIPEMRQNEGVLIILSNAAAAQLGASDARFDCSITY